ncbi:MAG TPA: hypothetical protein VG369_11230, partial [Humibacter sp.]|nr:hypothetical protein [Humibacter sp.]
MSERSDARVTVRRAAAAVATVVAALVLFVATLAPGLIASGSGLAVLRIPVEAVLGLLVLALLPWTSARRIVAAFIAVILVSAVVLAALDKGFETTLSRPFNPVTDWPELRDAYGVLSDSAGGLGAAGLVALLLLAVAAALAAVTWALLRIDRVLRTHRRAALIGGSSVTAVWVVAALVGAQLVPGEPVAASAAIGTLEQKAAQAGVTAHDQAAFAKAAVSDPYVKLPASDLLTGLKGKDVIVAFIESYGQVAVQNTSFSSGVDKVLSSGNAQLAKAGYSERSAFLTSPTFGGISW